MTLEEKGEPQKGLSPADDMQWKIGLGLAETIAGLFFAGVAAYSLIAAQEFAHIGFNPNDPGPAAFPRTMGTLLLVCSLALAVIGIQRMRTGAGGEPVTIIRPLNVIAGAAGSLLYAFAMPFVTYYVATAIWFPFMLVLAGVRSWKWIVIATLVFMLFARLAFEVVLSINLP